MAFINVSQALLLSWGWGGEGMFLTCIFPKPHCLSIVIPGEKRDFKGMLTYLVAWLYAYNL